MIKILIIDKEQDVIRQLIEDWAGYDYECRFATNINDGIKKFLSFRPDIVITEYNLRNSSIKDLANRIHKLADIPIIVLSSRSDEAAILNSLQYGADDFIKKQGCSGKELFFRIVKILKNFRNRPHYVINDNTKQNTIRLPKIIINKNVNEVKKNNKLVFLSAIEYQLLLLLAQHKNHIVHTDTIIAQLFPAKDPATIKPTIYTYLSNIRKKLSLSATGSVQIKCISRQGYSLIIT